MPASTRILVVELETIAQFPRLPEASMDTHTPMFASILVNPVDSVVTFWLAGTSSGLPQKPWSDRSLRRPFRTAFSSGFAVFSQEPHPAGKPENTSNIGLASLHCAPSSIRGTSTEPTSGLGGIGETPIEG